MAVKIIKGEDIDLTVNLKQGEDCYDLTGYTDLAAHFTNADGSCLIKLFGSGITVVSESRGEILVALTDAETELLLGGTASFEVYIDFGTKRRIAQLKNALKIEDKLCS